MSSTASDTGRSRQGSETAEVTTPTDMYCTRRPSGSGANTKKREHDAFGRNAHGTCRTTPYCLAYHKQPQAANGISRTDARSKAKLQKLQEKVKVHQQYVEESIKAQPLSTTLPMAAAPTPVNPIFPPPTMQNDPALAVDFFMSRSPI